MAGLVGGERGTPARGAEPTGGGTGLLPWTWQAGCSGREEGREPCRSPHLPACVPRGVTRMQECGFR